MGKFKNAETVGYHCGSFNALKQFGEDSCRRVRGYGDLDGYGLEIECESTAIRDSNTLAWVIRNSAMALFPDDFVKFESDGSLVDTSTEMITQCFDKEFFYSHLEDWEALFDEVFPRIGVNNWRSKNAGMHTSVSFNQFGRDKGRLLKFIGMIGCEENWPFWVKFFGREEYENHYYEDGSGNPKVFYTLWDDVYDELRTHSAFVNLCHFDTGRVEFRLPSGCASFAQFKAYLEMTFHLVELSKTISWDDVTNLKKIFENAPDSCKEWAQNYRVSTRWTKTIDNKGRSCYRMVTDEIF